MTEISGPEPADQHPKDGGTQGIPNIINQIQTMQTALQKMDQRLRSEGTDRYANVVDTQLQDIRVQPTAQNCTWNRL